MIKTFRHKGLAELFATGRSRRVGQDMTARLIRMLDALDQATAPGDMALPGFHFHALTGKRAGSYSCRVTGNYRLTFRWQDGATDVDLEDYH